MQELRSAVRKALFCLLAFSYHWSKMMAVRIRLSCIKDRKVDLASIDKVNYLSRRIQKSRLDYEAVMRELEEIEKPLNTAFP